MVLFTYLDMFSSGMKVSINTVSQPLEQPDNWKPFLTVV